MVRLLNSECTSLLLLRPKKLLKWPKEVDPRRSENGKLQMKGLVTTIAVAAAPINATPASGTSTDLKTGATNAYGSGSSTLDMLVGLVGIGVNLGIFGWYNELAK